MKATTQKLALTDFDYEMMVFGFYDRWCESVTTNIRDCQAVLANSAVNAWFLMELSKCETEFHHQTDRYDSSSITPKDYIQCYNNCSFRLFNIRPMALLEDAKTKPPKGMPAFNSLNQN